MPQYLFHFRHPEETIILDDEGEEYRDLKTAKREAARLLREIVAETIKQGADATGFAIDIAGTAGNVLAVVTADPKWQ